MTEFSAATRILHLEDSKLDASLVKAELVKAQPDVDLNQVATREAYEKELAVGGIDIILCDYQLPSYSGARALAKARETQPDVPFIFVSGALGEEIAIEAMKLGATDYVVKDRLQRLPAVITRALEENAERLRRRAAERELVDSEAKFRYFAENVPVLVWVVDAAGACTYLPTAWSSDYLSEQDASNHWLDALHGDERDEVKAAFFEALHKQTPFTLEHRLVRQDGTTRWVINSGVPKLSNDGSFEGMIGSMLDVSERHFYEMQLARKAEEFESLADNIDQLAWMANADGWIYWYNKRWFDYTGSTLEEMQGWGWRAAHHEDHVERVVAKINRHFESGEPWEDTFPLRRHDGQWRWFLSRARAVRNAQGRIVRWLGTNTDITGRLKAERQRRLLINELNHRVKNTLSTVQAMAGQTMRMESSLTSFKDKFRARLSAHAAAHDLLTQESWRGADMLSLVRDTVRSQVDEERLELDGPVLHLSPRVTLAVAMALHELATNAVKYGAWSNADGIVSITWRRSGERQDRFHLTWQERDGPPVTPPTREGFGTRLITRNLAQDLKGTVDVDYAVDGLSCVIDGGVGSYNDLVDGDDGV